MNIQDAASTAKSRCHILAKKSYAKATTVVARNILGSILVSTIGSITTAGRIVEVEAYLGSGDPSAHSYNGPTPRTAIQWGSPGHAYVYLIYGMYHCLNFVTEPVGTPGCVLIRALEPLVGLECMFERRNRPRLKKETCNGPGKLTQALGIDRSHNGTDLSSNPLFVSRGEPVSDSQVRVSPRIGIVEATDMPLRFFVHSNDFVSRHAHNQIARPYCN